MEMPGLRTPGSVPSPLTPTVSVPGVWPVSFRAALHVQGSRAGSFLVDIDVVSQGEWHWAGSEGGIGSVCGPEGVPQRFRGEWGVGRCFVYTSPSGCAPISQTGKVRGREACPKPHSLLAVPAQSWSPVLPVPPSLLHAARPVVSMAVWVPWVQCHPQRGGKKVTKKDGMVLGTPTDCTG